MKTLKVSQSDGTTLGTDTKSVGAVFVHGIDRDSHSALNDFLRNDSMLNPLRQTGLAIAAALAMGAGHAHAGVVISNYAPALSDGTSSTIASATGQFSKAAGFTLGAGVDYNLDFLTLRLGVSDLSAVMSLTLFGDVGGNPSGPALASFVVPALALGIADYVFVPAAAFVLQDLSTYWIAATGSSPTANGITWMAENPGLTPTGLATSAGYRFSNAGIFPPVNGSVLFNTYSVNGTVIGSVPEPTSLALLAVALTGLALVRTRSR
jgi:hypothetical protein